MGYELPTDPAEREAFLAANRRRFEAARARKGLPAALPVTTLEDAADYLSSTPSWDRVRRSS